MVRGNGPAAPPVEAASPSTTPAAVEQSEGVLAEAPEPLAALSPVAAAPRPAAATRVPKPAPHRARHCSSGARCLAAAPRAKNRSRLSRRRHSRHPASRRLRLQRRVRRTVVAPVLIGLKLEHRSRANGAPRIVVARVDARRKGAIDSPFWPGDGAGRGYLGERGGRVSDRARLGVRFTSIFLPTKRFLFRRKRCSRRDRLTGERGKIGGAPSAARYSAGSSAGARARHGSTVGRRCHRPP